MSLEDRLSELAISLDRWAHHANVAVVEIIKQRNGAIRQRDQWKRDAEYYLEQRNDWLAKYEHERRVSNGLRSAIKRMKKVRS